MKLQAKSLFSSISQAVAPKAQSVEAIAGNHTRSVELKTVANLQALASELRLFATEGTFEYPRNWVQIAGMAALVFMGLAFSQILMLVLPVIQALLSGVPLSQVAISPLKIAGVVVGVVLAFGLASVLLDLFPKIRVAEQGLGISGLFGWRRVRWDQVGVLRVMELSDDRYIVMLPFVGTSGRAGPAPLLRIIPALAGAATNGERGVLVSSHIKDFDRLIQLIVSNMSQAKGMSVPRIELFVDETSVMPLAQLLLAPEDAIVRMARAGRTQTSYGMPMQDEEPEVDTKKVATRQALLASPPVLLLLVFEAIRGGLMPQQVLWAGVVLALGIAELPFVAKLSQAVGDITVGSGQYKRSIIAYLELQAPRAVLLMLGVALTAIGVPVPVAEVGWLVGIGLTTWFTIRFVQRVYYIPIRQTLWAAIGTFMFQIVLFALYFGVS
jgi:hypothetical protein